ncbi:NUDIX hydrolase [Alkalicoccus halolimnae]|uniref:NUDIX domain-containing protein n=1 Tax=Alkalicoccus halolimnae TaxID=1667239 RepID=A0A5C7F462_9BACI|nr:NUDIX domain-containing protein [Alkalicoccus halolimnae]TXF84317.1 NUDIX domain-containing protein [Alkalicoccus halolimnae]
MQRIANCIIQYEGRILLLKKPRRGWWYLPGGKIIHEELLPDAIKREVYEETGLTVKSPVLRGILTHLVLDEDTYIEKRTMFIFQADSFTGTVNEKSAEGELAWVRVEDLSEMAMDEADRTVIKAVLEKKELLYGTFIYDHRRELQSHKMEFSSNTLS